MAYKAKKTLQDMIEFHKDDSVLSRRRFLQQSAALGAVGFLGAQFLGRNLAQAATTLSCPPTTALTPGGFGQVYMLGGPAAVPIFPSMITNAMNSNMAPVYGVTGANLTKIGGNWMTDTQTPWGQVLMAGPPGVSASAWTAILKNTYIGGAYGDLGQDDGNGQDEGLVSGFALINGKGGGNPKDILFNTSNKQASYAVGPSISPASATPAGLAATLSLTPAASGLTTAVDLANASAAALAIENAYESINPVSGKKGGANLLSSAGCGFNNNPPTATSTYGTSKYTASSISAITGLVPNVANMLPQNQAILAAAYQSALGFNGGTIFTNGSCDYHNTTNQNTANQDQTNANAVVAMLAGFAAAGQNGVIQINANGFAGSNGTGAAAITINNATTATNVQSPSATGDAGSTFSQNLLLFYSANAATVSPTMLGSLVGDTGEVQGAAGSPANSMAGMAASALVFLTGSIPNAFLKASNLTAAQLTPLMVLS